MSDTQPKDEVTVPDGLLAHLEHDFKEAMQALEAEESLGHFRLEYDKMYRALRKSHESEKQLVAKCQELTHKLVGNAAKVQAAIKLSQGDHSTIEALKKEIEKAWRAVDTANDKDLRARETVKSLQQQVVSLQMMVEKGSTVPTDHTITVEELRLSRRNLQSDTEAMAKRVATYTREIKAMTSSLKQSEGELQGFLEEDDRVVGRLEHAQQELRRERDAQERTDYQCRELLSILKARKHDVKTIEEQEALLGASVAELRDQHHAKLERKRVLTQKLETTSSQLFHTQKSVNDGEDTTTDLNERLLEADQQIIQTEKEIVERRHEVEQVARIKDNDFKELLRLRQVNATAHLEHENLERQKTAVAKQINAFASEKRGLEEALQLLEHEREVLKKRGDKEVAQQAAVEALTHAERDNHSEVEESVSREKNIAADLAAQLRQLEMQGEKGVEDAARLSAEHLKAMDELKSSELELREAQKQIEEREAKLNEQQAAYEQGRVERNQLSKRLLDAQDEIVELKQNAKMIGHQIAQLKEEVQLKEKKYLEAVAQQKRAEERLTTARRQVNSSTAHFDAVKSEAEALGQQIKQLVKQITNCEAQLSKQRGYFLTVSGERDLLASQLMRRNDELALLFEKIRLQQGAINRGESALQAHVNDLRLLRIKTADIQRQSVLAKTRAKHVSEVKTKLRRIGQDLSEEEAKVKALSEELENPQNAVRWRTLTGADPSSEELDARMRELQGRLITKSEQNLEQELLLQEKTRLVTELRAILERQPGPEVARQLNAYHRDLEKQNADMKRKAAELNMTSTYISELKYDAERLRREIHDMRRRFYEVKLKVDSHDDAPDQAATM